MKGVVLDWDGTLVDTLAALYRANVAVLGDYGIPFDEVTYRRNYTPDWRLMYRRLGVPPERLDEANERWLDHYRDGREVSAFPGAADALRRMSAAGSRLGLVTAGHRAVVERQLEATGLAELLPVRVFGDDLPVQKPDPEPLRLALARLGLADRPAEAAYLGDAPDDMRMARAVGAVAVGVGSILGDPAELRSAGAAEVVASVVEWADRHFPASLARGA